jgi:rubredoxin
MAVWQCGLCSYAYDEDGEGVPFAELPEDWVCPVCGSPKSAFVEAGAATAAPVAEAEPAAPSLDRYQCDLCAHVYDEAQEDVRWADLPDDWVCPVCGSGKSSFVVVGAKADTVLPPAAPAPMDAADYLAEWRRPADDFETHMADIHRISDSGHSLIEPMRTRVPSFSWDEILVRGAQLARLPLNKSQPVNTRTVIGPGAAVPLVLETPLLVSHMSFGALSREAKLALAKALEAVKGGTDLPATSIFVCPVCGNTVEGAAPDVCPICNVPGEKFIEIA